MGMGSYTLHVPHTSPANNNLPNQRIEVPGAIFISCQRVLGRVIRHHLVLHLRRNRNERRSRHGGQFQYDTVILQYGYLRHGRYWCRYAFGKQDEATATFSRLSRRTLQRNDFRSSFVHNYWVHWIHTLRTRDGR